MIKSIGIFTFCCLIATNILADVSVTLSVSENRLTMNEEIQLQVSVEGSNDVDHYPELLKSDGLDLSQGGQSSRMSIINGHTSVEKSFSFYGFPTKEGKFTIGPAEVSVNGQKYQSNTVVVEVISSQQNKQAQENEKGREVQANRDYFITASVSNEHPYVNEQIVYTFRLYNRGNISDASLAMPDFEGFWKEELNGQKKNIEIVNGVKYEVIEMKTALYPLKAQKIEIPSAVLNAQALIQDTRRQRRGRSMFDSFFDDGFLSSGRRAKRIRLASKKLIIDVKELPTEGRPKNFNGAVGKFKYYASLSKINLKVGDSATLTVTLEGDGNIRPYTLNDWSINGFKTYDDKPQVSIRPYGDRIFGKKIFKMALVPTKEFKGHVRLPSFSFFDSKEQKYKTLDASLPDITVSPNLNGQRTNNLIENENRPDTKKKAIKVQGVDLMPNMEHENHYITHSFISNKYFILFFNIIFGFIYAFISFFKYKKKLYEGNDLLRRKEMALRQFKKNLQAINGSGNCYPEVSNALRMYLGDKLGVDGMALTSNDARVKLNQHGLKNELTNEVVVFLQNCEMQQYGGNVGQNISEKQLKQKLDQIVGRLEKEVR